MIFEVHFVKDEGRIQKTPLNTLRPSRLQLWILCISTIVYVGYCIFSSYEVPTSVGEFRWSLGGVMGHNQDITLLEIEDVSESIPRYSSKSLLEYPFVINVSWMN